MSYMANQMEQCSTKQRKRELPATVTSGSLQNAEAQQGPPSNKVQQVKAAPPQEFRIQLREYVSSKKNPK